MQERFETFTVLINRISRNIRKIKNHEMAQYDLKSPHVSCLYYLYAFRGLTATDLCERCAEDKATISRSLTHLEKNGFLTRESGSKRYKGALTLTDKGQKVGKQIADKIDCVLSQIGRQMSDEERVLFYRHLTLISDGLEAYTQQYEIEGE